MHFCYPSANTPAWPGRGPICFMHSALYWRHMETCTLITNISQTSLECAICIRDFSCCCSDVWPSCFVLFIFFLLRGSVCLNLSLDINADFKNTRRRWSSEWPTTVWRKWCTGPKSPLRPSARPASRGGIQSQSSHQVDQEFLLSCFSPRRLFKPELVDRVGQPGGRGHRSPGSDRLLDGLHEGSHRGGLAGRLAAPHHRRLGSGQPPRHHHRPPQRVCVERHPPSVYDMFTKSSVPVSGLEPLTEP